MHTPAALLLQLLAAVQQLRNLAAGIGDGDRRWKLGDRGNRKKQRDSRKARAEAD